MKRTRLLLGIAVLVTVQLAVSCGKIGGNAVPTDSAQSNSAPSAVEVARVISQKLNIIERLPGELTPYEEVAFYPKVTGFVKSISVDRGSLVSKGELLAVLEAPELLAHRAEAESKLASTENQLVASQAKLAADQSTYEKLAIAARTPGVVAGNDLIQAKQAAEADRATVKALASGVQATKDSLRSLTVLTGYLRITAPFNGIITERNVHPGALVGPAGGPGAMVPMFRIQTLDRMRLVVPVPETDVADVPKGTSVAFTVPAFPAKTFHAPIARISHAISVRTRTMPVELDVRNQSELLTPGSYCQVLWPVRRSSPTLFVPSSAVATNLEQTFVILIVNGKTQWIDVTTGDTAGKMIEVFGNLKQGDEVVLRATDALGPGTAVTPKVNAGED